jgi:parvulin-like peptidyl-prolyl isomerase
MIGRFTVILSVAACLAGCADLTAPSGHSKRAEQKAEAAPAEKPAAVATAAASAVKLREREPPPAAEPSGEMIRASHILVAYQGAMRASPEITRSKDDAKKRAEVLAGRAKKGDDFAKLAAENSDDPTAKLRGGDLGKFTKDRMVKPFADAAFAIKPGEISTVIETPFGYHVIKRTE